MTKRKNPETSVEAYRSIRPEDLAEIHQNILWALSQIKEGTFEEIAYALRIPKERVWKRLSELQKLGLIYRPGNKKALSSGRLGYTWRTVTEEPTIIVTERSLPGDSVADYSRKLIEQKMF